MQFITNIKVSRFKSIQEARLENLSDFSVIAGLNNSGKSNFLRAVYFFFTGHIEPNVPFSFARDYFRPELSSKKRKRVEIEMTFSLPASFKFRTDLKSVEKLLGKSFTLTREWGPDSQSAAIYLDDGSGALPPEDVQKVETFLRLISVRYIPNRVMPTALIAQEHQALRDVLVRRLAKLENQSSALFKAIGRTSSELIAEMSDLLRSAAPELTGVALSTAESLADLAFRFGYVLNEGDTKTTEDEQGSGIQSLLMFRTLSMIDQDFFKQFGWKQAALWLVEEPESSLHMSLEAQIAYFLAKLSTSHTSRLQAIATTHSDLMVQYSTQAYLVRKEPISVGKKELKSVAHQREKRALLKEAAQAGISRWVNPILQFPLDPIVLVEGKSDVSVLEAAHKALGTQPTYRIVCLSALLEDPAKGGVDSILEFIKKNREAIKTRSSAAKVVVLLDWDAANKLPAFSSLFKSTDPFAAIAWDETEANPTLEKTFRGVERFLATRIIDTADLQCNGIIGKKANGNYSVSAEDLAKLKAKTGPLVQAGLKVADAQFCKGLLEKLSIVTKPI
jgi:hypothetical protein